MITEQPMKDSNPAQQQEAEQLFNKALQSAKTKDYEIDYLVLDFVNTIKGVNLSMRYQPLSNFAESIIVTFLEQRGISDDDELNQFT